MIDLIKAENILSKKELAQCLFPGNKYPVRALNRQIKLTLALDEDQISRLALMLQTSIVNLQYNDYSKCEDYILKFKYQDYEIHLNTRTLVAGVFALNHIGHADMIYSKNTTMSEFFASINEITEK